MRRSSFVVAILIAVASTAMSAQERSLDDVKRDVTRRVAQRQPPSMTCVPMKSRGFGLADVVGQGRVGKAVVRSGTGA